MAATTKHARSDFVPIRGRRYHVRIWGDEGAPTFFFLHGWCDVAASFQFVVDQLRRDWRVIAPDWRGFGLSQWNEGAYWFPDYVADLDAILEHYSPHEPVRVVGHSLGGNVTGFYGGARPERLARFVNLEGFGLWVAGPQETPTRLAQWLKEVREDAPMFRRYGSREEFAAKLCRDNHRLKPERAAFLAAHSLREVAGGFMFAGESSHRWINPLLVRVDEAKACWGQVKAPTLWVAARDSFIMKSFAERQDEYRERLACYAGAREVMLDDCGHNLHHDQPEKIAELVEEFFS